MNEIFLQIEDGEDNRIKLAYTKQQCEAQGASGRARTRPNMQCGAPPTSLPLLCLMKCLCLKMEALSLATEVTFSWEGKSTEVRSLTDTKDGFQSN